MALRLQVKLLNVLFGGFKGQKVGRARARAPAVRSEPVRHPNPPLLAVGALGRARYRRGPLQAAPLSPVLLPLQLLLPDESPGLFEWQKVSIVCFSRNRVGSQPVLHPLPAHVPVGDVGSARDVGRAVLFAPAPPGPRPAQLEGPDDRARLLERQEVGALLPYTSLAPALLACRLLLRRNVFLRRRRGRRRRPGGGGARGGQGDLLLLLRRGCRASGRLGGRRALSLARGIGRSADVFRRGVLEGDLVVGKLS